MARWTALVLLFCASCLSTQDFAGPAPDATPDLPDASDASDAPSPPDSPDAADGATTLTPDASSGPMRWEWMNPAPTGKTLYGIGGTANDDVWVAGEGGTIAHFNGTSWDIRHTGPESTRYFAVGTRKRNDVWVAGDANGQSTVVHFDGTNWVDSVPFAGATFATFSHGPGPRLFAVLGSAISEEDILELADDGTWIQTDTRDNLFLFPTNVWVAESGEVWALGTSKFVGASGPKLMHLPAGSQKWEVFPTPPSVPDPPHAQWLGLSGAGSTPCAFYTNHGATTSTGLLRYDGTTWNVASSSNGDNAPSDPSHSSNMACLADGNAMTTFGKMVMYASPQEPPANHTLGDYAGETITSLLSFDGNRAFAVGAFGALLSWQASDGLAWEDVGTSVRKEIVGVDVGLDGIAMAVDFLQADPSGGGDVLVWHDAWRTARGSGGLLPPDAPVGVATLAANDAWVLSNDGGGVNVAHFSGSWGVGRNLASDHASTMGNDALAIWAPQKDDVWVTGREHCPDLNPLPGAACSKKLQGYAWHYDGSSWDELPADGAYVSIHGTGPKDVWFAGDGVAHWDGHALTTVSSLDGHFAGVWSSAPGRVWLWGDRALLFDGNSAVPITTVLNVTADWIVTGIAESAGGDLFVLIKRAVGTSLLWFDPSRTRLVEQLSSDLELSLIRGRGDQLWAVGSGGATLRFSPAPIN